MKINLKYVWIFFLLITVFSCKKHKEEKKELETSAVSDIEGNIYKTVKIGDQWWMAENLRVKKYNDGSSILEVVELDNDSVWAKQTEGAFYYNDISSCFLYNGFAVKDVRKVAPTGWHIPTDEEWKTLEKTMGMNAEEANNTAWRGANIGDKMAIKSSIGWPSTSILFGTNEFGFTAVPGGNRGYDGYKNKQASMAFWWSSTTIDNHLWYRYLDYQKTEVFRQHIDKNYGFNIRCVKD